MKNVLLATLCHCSQIMYSHSGSCHNKNFWSPLVNWRLRLLGDAREVSWRNLQFLMLMKDPDARLVAAPKNLQSLMLIESAADSWGNLQSLISFASGIDACKSVEWELISPCISGCFNWHPRLQVFGYRRQSFCQHLIHPASFPYSWISVWFIWFRS